MGHKTVLIIGQCGVGKTWVMRNLLNHGNFQHRKLGQFIFAESDRTILIGKYDGSIFEGSDKLSMAIMRDLSEFVSYAKRKGKLVICEGDRFTNSTFIEGLQPFILKISGDGSWGRQHRKSNQTDSHLKRIATRVSRIESHKTVSNSTECLRYLLENYAIY